MQPQTFDNITADRFERLKARAAVSGLHIDADSGSTAIASPLGNIKFDYSYDRTGNSLMIHCTDKPWTVPEHTVTSELQTLITATA